MGRGRLALLCGALALLGPGCADVDASNRTRAPADASSVCAALSGIRPTADYDPAQSPRQLAARSELVVQGTMREVVKGRLCHPGDVLPGRTVVMVVEVTKTHRGHLPGGNQGRIYIESQPHGNLPASHFDRLLPRQAPSLFYLLPYPLRGNEADLDIDDKFGGRPFGQPLWQLTTPQGFLVEFEGDGAVAVPECKRYPEAHLSDFYPDRAAFPAEG